MVSAAILLAAWLDLPLAGIAERVLGIKGADKVDPARAWSAVCAVLLYLAYRFAFSDDEQKARDALSTDWQSQRNGRIRRILLREARQAAAGQRPPSPFGVEAAKYFDHEAEAHHIDRKDGGVLAIESSEFGVQHDAPWQGKVSVSWHAILPGGNRISSSGRLLSYSFDGLRGRLPVVLPAGLILVLRSKTSSVAIFPVALALLAMGCASFQAAGAWLR